MPTYLFVCVTVGMLVLAVERELRGAERKIVLRDHINQQWTRELVTYPFEARRGECHERSVRLSGPDGPAAVQLSEVEYWPGRRCVKSARLSFIVDELPPLGTKTYTVHYAEEATDSVLPTTDLRVSPLKKGMVELSTSAFGARLLQGQVTYPEPVPAADVPGPLVDMWLPDGTRFGGSRMYGEGKIKGYSARLTAGGPVFAEVTFRYVYADGNTLDLKAHVAAGDSAVMWDADVRADRPDSGWQVVLNRGLPPLSWRAAIESSSKLAPRLKRDVNVGDWVDVPLEGHPPGVVTNLSPWHDWWDEYTQTVVRLQMQGKDEELRLTRRDAGVWVEPMAPGTMGDWSAWQRKLVPLIRSESGEVCLRINNAQGRRRWAIGVHPVPKQEDPDFAYMGRYKIIRHGAVGRHLNQAKDYVLDWPAKTEHPHLYLDRKQLEEIWRRGANADKIEEMLRLTGTDPEVRSSYGTSMGVGAYLLTGRKDVANRALIVERLGHLLGKLAYLDTWRANGMVCSLYDAVMGSGLLPPEEQKLFRAQLAYLGYRSADPATWSMERGYCSGNLNMSVANYMLLGILACTIPDHPMAQEWCRPALVMMEEMLSRKVGPAGEWPESVAHYAHVSASPLLLFAIVARNAGMADFIGDERMKRLHLFLAKQYTPPDPRHTESDRRGQAGLLPPVGRGPAGEAFGLHGAMARATAESDPAYSRVLQWVWLRTGQPRRMTGDHMIGWEQVYMDPALPAEKPDWGLDFFPETGAIMRHGVGGPDEWYVYMISERTYTVPAESGTLPMVFAKGVPISARFACSYPDREELLLNRVLLARGRGTPEERSANYSHQAQRRITHVSDLPRQQYVAGDFTIDEPWRKDMGQPRPNSYSHLRILPEWPPVEKEGKPGVKWRRQVLFVRDDDPAGTGYLVLRDTVSGGQPTMWQFWTVSEKIGTPQQAAEREAFLADAPGNRTIGPRRLPQGVRYTALGQFDVDVEFFIAEPRSTPRHTLRFGLTHAYVTLGGYTEYQDLLHLQRPDDGTYFVAIYPRKRTEEVPNFERPGDGTIIKVSGGFGTDLCFLSGQAATASADEASFDGTVGSVQDRASGLALSLGAKGEVRYKQYGIAGDSPAGLRVGRDALTVELPPDHPGSTVTVHAPGTWALKEPAGGATLARGPGERFTLTVPKGISTVGLTAQ